jgi:hypothetical protein
MGNKEKKKQIYVGDFETTTDINDCRVWAYGLYNIYEEFVEDIGIDIDSLFSFLSKKNSEVYFHNLKFDGQFIIYWLKTHGYEYSEKKLDKTFNTLITDTGQYYSIEVIFKKNKRDIKKVTFKDSLKKLPFPVSTIAKMFGLKEQKLEIDYHAKREVGHKLTKEEEMYLRNDIIIVGKALKIQFDNDLIKMTVASDAMSWFKSKLGQEFKAYFPVLDLETDDYIRKSYKGGWTYLKPRYANKTVKNGHVYDVNSLYPSVMYNEVLPFGLPVYFEGEYEESKFYPCFIQRIRACFKLKKGYLPTIQLKGNMNYQATEYITTTNGEIEELTLTNVDLKLFLEHYKVDYIEYLDGYKFRGCRGMFKEYIDYWGHIKETSEGATRTLAKLMLNSLYGKFASNPKKCCKYPFMNTDDYISYSVPKDDEGKIIYEIGEPIFTAMASFITAYARNKTIRSAQENFKDFVYADTDSLHLLALPKNLEIHDKKLGYWKHESDFEIAKFVRAKTYIEQIDGKLDVKCAGMPSNVKKQVTFKNFKSGSVFHGKLLPKNCKGGVVLMETDFTIK